MSSNLVFFKLQLLITNIIRDLKEKIKTQTVFFSYIANITIILISTSLKR